MKVIYIAGPFRAPTPWGVEQNVRVAEEAAYKIWTELGAVAVCPHTNSRFFDGEGSEQVWVDGYLELLRRCDAILVIGKAEDIENSVGTMGELLLAKQLGLPTFFAMDGLRMWLEDEERHPKFAPNYQEVVRMLENLEEEE